MLHLCRTKNKLPILAVNRRPARKGRKIAIDKSAFLYSFAIITISPVAEGGPVCNYMSPNFDSWSL